jgi:DNA polymerase-3 subunit gamma/tau
MASYQSLYRRYRPQRFDEVLGQEHITRALRNAVRDGRVGHAYLFSGPRGTGKTSTARILAKVLNCAAPEDGEPCGKCESCVAVAEGRVIDWLLEQDAASKSKVDDMRDLLERVPLGTSGNRKVIILDEVHMLSQGAENALLKTLEEPPAHVVFVLATTDPQKVRPTIRSRTQHFEFRLLPPDVLGDHVRHVIADAGLGLDDGAIDGAVDHVLRSGGGSARDTLSALDQVAALGEVLDEAEPVGAVVDALVAADAGRVLVAVADALASGRDPRTLGEAVIADLRDAFLAVMGAGDKHLPPAVRDRAAAVGEALGPAGLTRALDVLGEALTELSRKPDPRVVVEVALVRITEPGADRTLDAVLARLDRLERTVAAGGGVAGGPAPSAAGVGPGGGTPAPPAQGGAPAPPAGAPTAATPAEPPAAAPPRAGGRPVSAAAARDALSSARSGRSSARGTGKSVEPGPTTAEPGGPRPTLGAVTRDRKAATAATPAPDVDGEPPTPAPTSSPGTSAGSGPAGAGARVGSSTSPGATVTTPSTASPGAPTVGELEAVWTTGILAGLPVKIRSKWRAGRWADPQGDEVRFSVPNAWHKGACDEARLEVEQALARHFGRPMTVAVVVDGDAAAATPLPGDPAWTPGTAPADLAPADAVEDEVIDPNELRDAGDVATGGVDLLLREFGGGEVLQEDE